MVLGAQIEEALRIFQDMVQRGCERNVITYSSLVAACEKAGRWQLALELLEEMHRDNCKPNVITFNSLIAACGQGAPLSSPPAALESDRVSRKQSVHHKLRQARLNNLSGGHQQTAKLSRDQLKSETSAGRERLTLLIPNRPFPHTLLREMMTA